MKLRMEEWKWGVSFTPRSPYPRGMSPQYLFDTNLGEPQGRSGRGTKKKSMFLPEIEPMSSSL
jgi:hypothetical protein